MLNTYGCGLCTSSYSRLGRLFRSSASRLGGPRIYLASGLRELSDHCTLHLEGLSRSALLRLGSLDRRECLGLTQQYLEGLGRFGDSHLTWTRCALWT